MVVVTLGTAAGLMACTAGQNADEVKSEVEVTGCLTSSGDRFVLTSLDRADTGTTIASPATETYQLIGDVNAFRPHVGTQVRISGMAEAPDVAVVRESSPAAPVSQPGVGTSGTAAPNANAGAAAEAPAGATPKVSSEQQTRLEISSLRVREFAPTGRSCTP
jgi:hypothetical protein